MKSTHTDKVPRTLTGYLVAYVNESFDGRDICIYGDPEGLRSLGESLIAIADLDQASLAETLCAIRFHITTCLRLLTASMSSG